MNKYGHSILCPETPELLTQFYLFIGVFAVYAVLLSVINKKKAKEV